MGDHGPVQYRLPSNTRERLVDLEGCVQVHQTDKARLIDYEGTQVWLPKSQHEWHPDPRDKRRGTVTCTEQLATEKELI